MKKNLTEFVFILDRSGSMGGLEQDTIGEFNAMLTRQKEQEGEANVTTILFDHEVQLLHDRFPLKAVAPLTEKGTTTSGAARRYWTPLATAWRRWRTFSAICRRASAPKRSSLSSPRTAWKTPASGLAMRRSAG